MNVLYEENTTGTATYVYGPTGKLAKRTTINQETSTSYYHADRLGSTRMVTSDSKNIVSAVTYHPFGGLNTEENPDHYLFNGKERDSTGLYYYGARYYDPEIGRFLERDQKGGKISNPQVLNQYLYCVNNPLKYIDPDGHDYFNPEWAKEWQVEDRDTAEEEMGKPEIIGDPYYENGMITLPTTDGDVEVYNAHDEEGSENGTSGSWSEWEKKAYEMRVLGLLQEAEELQAKADMLNQHALAMSEITAGLAFCAVILSVTGIGGIIAGAAALATGAAAIALSIVASGYGEMARKKREEAMKLLESHL